MSSGRVKVVCEPTVLSWVTVLVNVRNCSAGRERRVVGLRRVMFQRDQGWMPWCWLVGWLIP